MHPFGLSRADDPAKAIAAHAHDPQLVFIAGGTDLIGLMRDRATLPERLLCRTWRGSKRCPRVACALEHWQG